MIECCCIDVDYEACAKVYDASIRRAWKTHECCECGEAINPGDQYEFVRALYPEAGGWDQFKTCLFCFQVRRDFFPCGFYHTQMVDEFVECYGWDYRELPKDDE